jgi:methionyl-tRNA formyltransferase
MNNYRIIFMGTPEFSVPSLLSLHDSKYEISLVITQPDRRRGRGRKEMPPPVKKTAMALGYEVFQPSSFLTDEVFEKIQAVKPIFIVTVAYGHILPEKILNIPKLASLNIHASLLPKYRGAAPIQRAIMEGEKETGVTIMFMDTGLDTGDILLSETVPIHLDDTAQSLHDRLANAGGPLLLKTLQGFEENSLTPIPQDDRMASYAQMLEKENGHINWRLSADQLVNLIRGTTPWPGAFTFYQDRRIKIFKAIAVEAEVTASPGSVLKGFPGELRVATGNGILSILEIQGASGKRLSIQDFLRGHDFQPGTIFS